MKKIRWKCQAGKCDWATHIIIFFVEFLVEHFSLEKLQRYLKKYLETPDDYKKIFEEVYLINLDDILIKFNANFF